MIKKYTFLIFALSVPVIVVAQDLFSKSNAYQFANYLYTQLDFELAEMEYQRLFFAQKSDSLAAARYFECNYQLQNYTKTQKVYQQYYKALPVQDAFVNNVYLRSLVLLNAPELQLELNEIKPVHRDYYALTSYILQSDWDKAHQLYAASSDDWCKKHASILVLQETMQYKKPALAAAMSAVIPGAGKAYTGYWQDAVFSFLFVSLGAWQAYRGFDKKGVESVYGWIYGGLSAGFYIGDIFGSYKAANKRNYSINHELHHQVKATFLSTDF